MDHHAAGGAVKHGSWKLIRKKDANEAATPDALDFDWFCSVVRVHVKCMFANMHIACLVLAYVSGVGNLGKQWFSRVPTCCTFSNKSIRIGSSLNSNVVHIL